MSVTGYVKDLVFIKTVTLNPENDEWAWMDYAIWEGSAYPTGI
jgi:hypothetical protein